MRADVIFEIFGVHEGREEDVYLGAFRTRQEAQLEIDQLRLKVMHGGNWAQRYHNKGFAIREKVVTTDFEVPARPTPREKYFVVTTPKPNPPGSWESTRVRSTAARQGRTNPNEFADTIAIMGCSRRSSPSDRRSGNSP